MILPTDFGLGSTWVFWVGIVIGLGGFGAAYAGYIADQQTTARIESVKQEASVRINAAEEAARRRIAELEAKTAVRRLSESQRVLFSALFHSTTERVRVSYMTGQGSGDVAALITDLLETAKQSGAAIGGNGTVFAVLPAGISFQANPNDSETMARLRAFAAAIGQRVEVTPIPSSPPGSLTVLVGPRGPGFP